MTICAEAGLIILAIRTIKRRPTSGRRSNWTQNSVDANYVLGLVLKAKEKDEEAIEAFKVAINLINNGKVENLNRAEMLRRLALGHVNEIKEGDWKLEEEFWRRER